MYICISKGSRTVLNIKQVQKDIFRKLFHQNTYFSFQNILHLFIFSKKKFGCGPPPPFTDQSVTNRFLTPFLSCHIHYFFHRKTIFFFLWRLLCHFLRYCTFFSFAAFSFRFLKHNIFLHSLTEKVWGFRIMKKKSSIVCQLYKGGLMRNKTYIEVLIHIYSELKVQWIYRGLKIL